MSSDLTIYMDDNSLDTDATNLTETTAAAGPEIVITSSPGLHHRRLTATYSAPSNFGGHHRASHAATAPAEPANKVQI